VKHPQEQVLRPAGRAPESPRDLGGTTHDQVVMRIRRQYPVKYPSHGHMISASVTSYLPEEKRRIVVTAAHADGLICRDDCRSAPQN